MRKSHRWLFWLGVHALTLTLGWTLIVRPAMEPRPNRAKQRQTAPNSASSQSQAIDRIVLDYIRDNTGEPDSVELIQWANIGEATYCGGWGPVHGIGIDAKWRAKTPFGGYAVFRQVVLLDKADYRPLRMVDPNSQDLLTDERRRQADKVIQGIVGQLESDEF